MKSIKHITAVVLALVMMLALAATAFAAEPLTGKITVANPQEGQTYTAYKVLDVSYAGKDAVSYSISANSEWFDVVQSYGGLKLTNVSGTDKYVVEKTNDFSAASFANLLKNNAEGKQGTVLAAAGTGVAAANLELGYYFVSSTSGALCNLTTTALEATIHDKNDVTFDKKDDKATADIGETVNYVITGNVPDTTGFKSYDYTIADTMSEGLTFTGTPTDGTVKITVDGETLDAAKYEYTQTNNGFTLKISVMDLQDKVGKEIKVTYSAVLNEKATAVISANSATLTYSNDPTNETKKTTTPEVVETVYSSEIDILKYDKNNEAKKLSGATFVLKNTDDKYYKWDDAKKAVTWVGNLNDATAYTTDTNGKAAFIGLKDGTYYLEETVAPAGYNLLTEVVTVKVDGTAATKDNAASLKVETKVANSTGTTLPETGGIGTTVFYVLGSLLVVGATVLLVVKKRMSMEK